MIKIYIKKGVKNYKEARLLSKLTPAIQKKIAENPQFASEFKPVTSYDELQKLYNIHCVDNVEFEEIKNEPEEKYEEHKNFRENMEVEKTTDKEETKSFYDDDNSFIDPLNREEPNVRGYVTENEFPNEEQAKQTSFRSSFDEPTSFKDSFEMPGDEVSTSKPSNSTQQKQLKQKNSAEPMNPKFGEMDNGKKKRSTKKFAKYIVETTCMLSEKGFEWYANKDINEAKLAEYELNDEMDLDLLVTLEDGQEATVKQFFQLQCMKAQQLSKIDAEEKADLVDALAEVLLEKGVAPTPAQELMLISAKIFGGQIVALFSLKSQTNSLLEQLRNMKEEQGGQRQRPQPKQEPTPNYAKKDEEESAIIEKEIFVEEPTQETIKQAEKVLTEGDYDSIIDEPIQTIE